MFEMKHGYFIHTRMATDPDFCYKPRDRAMFFLTYYEYF